MAKTLCCCCFSNNVRHLILFLSIACSSSLFANLLLFNITVVYNRKYHISSDRVELHASTIPHRRAVRQISYTNATEVDDRHNSAVPADTDVMDISENATQEIASELLRTEKDDHSVASGEDEYNAKITDDKYTERQAAKAGTIFFTRSSLETVERTTELPVDNLTTATRASPHGHVSVTKKTFTQNDKDFTNTEMPKWTDLSKSSDTSESTDGIVITDVQEDPMQEMETLLLWISPGIGILCGAAATTFLMYLLGARKLFTGALLLSAAATIPLAFVLSVESAFAGAGLRFVQGIAFATVFPVIGCISANWSPLKEQFFFLSWSTLFIQLTPLVSWPISVLMLKYDFKLTYFMHAAFSVVSAIIWLVFYRDRPQYHPWVNGLELNKIVTGKIKAVNNRTLEEKPCSSILIRSMPVWAIWAAAFAYFVITGFALQFMPSYFQAVVRESPSDSIFLASSLFLLMFLVNSLYAAWIKLARLCEANPSIMICNILSFVLCCIVFIFLAIYPVGGLLNYGVISSFSVLLGCIAFSMFGFGRSATLVGRFYSQFIVSAIQFTMGAAFLFISLVVFYVVRTSKPNEWRLIFASLAALLLICAAIFGILGSADAPEWAKDTWDPSAARRMVSIDQIDYHNDECGVLEMRLLDK